MRPFRSAALGLFLALGLGAAHAGVVFQDGFEGTLAKWGPVGSGVLLADPLNGANHVLGFRAEGSGGDVFTTQPYIAGGSYYLSFDVLGTCQGGNCGAFIGIDQFPGGEVWVVGDNTWNGSVMRRVVSNGQWQHVEVAFTAAPQGNFRVKVEDFSGGAVAGDVYFDNICVSTVAGDAGCASNANVPEPGSLALAGVSLLALAGLRRRRG